MQWKRVAKATLAMAILACVGLAAPMIVIWGKAELQRRAELPNPVVAEPTEAKAIVEAVISKQKFNGPPPPPPPPPSTSASPTEPGAKLLIHPLDDLIVADSTACFDSSGSSSHCEIELTDVLFDPYLNSLASRKFREELSVANQESRKIDLSGIPRTRQVSYDDINGVFSSGDWKAFYAKYPHTAGFAQFSWPVLTPDKQEALVYVAYHCGGLCGVGYLLLLQRTGEHWNVKRQEQIWIS